LEVKTAFGTDLFCEPNGKHSFSRVATAVLIVFALIWVTRLVEHNHAFPDFTGLCFFIGTIYGLNKLGAAASSIAQSKPTQ
jgi:hypothetical protein